MVLEKEILASAKHAKMGASWSDRSVRQNIKNELKEKISKVPSATDVVM